MSWKGRPVTSELRRRLSPRSFEARDHREGAPVKTCRESGGRGWAPDQSGRRPWAEKGSVATRNSSFAAATLLSPG